ncbi:hypothetical protein FH972_007242 [Carpinus fangiana]|uniref:Phytocyanin domain-containing protein n=1 Tax=Carpinus fangiana TaxID=176857 RepID=A0A5N6QYB0_9ROSI|nr:hypothetical protein FH972_007242 [Carpinus fangiana]
MATMVNTMFLVLVFVALITKEALAAQHIVGGSQGWDESTDFDTWASDQTFKVGDQLVFKYTSGLHSVVELASDSAYKNCDLGSALDSMNGGSNVVKLNKAGTRYFACGTLGHCSQGMKVKIKSVTGSAPSSPASPTSSSSTSDALPSRSFVMAVALLATFMLYVL